VKQFLEYLKDQGISAPAFETLAEDLPYHEDAHGVAYGESYNVITEHDKSTPKLIPEITVYEATRELRSLTPTGNEGVEALNRRHSLTGRRVEMYFQAADGPPVAVPGRIEQVTSDPVKSCGIRWLGETELEFYSMQETCEHLTADDDG
jgi:hypothetical protein